MTDQDKAIALRNIALVILNALTIIAVYALIKPLGFSLGDLASTSFYARIYITNLVTYIVIAILHLVVSYILIHDIVLTYINRITLLIHQSMVLRELGEYVFIDTALLIGAPVIFRFFKIELRAGKTKRLLKQLYSRPKGLRNRITYLPLILSSHSIGVVFYQSLLLFTSGGLGVVSKSISYYFLLGFFIPLAQLVITAMYIDINAQSALTPGFISGFGLLGLPALLSAMTPRQEYLARARYRIFYPHGPGVMLGEALHVISYDYPDETCIAITERSLDKTWCWRRIHQPIYVRLEELNTPHIVIVGASGSGKTTLAKRVIYASHVFYDYNVIIIDQHGEYRDLGSLLNARIIDASSHIINPLNLENSSPRERALQLAHILSQYFRLGFKQRQLLEDIVLKTYSKKGIVEENPSTWRLEPPSIEDLVNTCRDLGETMQEYNRILPYLLLLYESFKTKNQVKTSDLLSSSVIFDLSKIPDDFTRVLYIDTLMYLLINQMYRKKPHGRIQLVIEEAREILPKEISRDLLSRLFAESRKFGFSIMVITQELHRLPRTLVNNAGLRVFFVLNEPDEIEEAARIIAGIETRDKALFIAESIRTLDPHVFIVHATGSNEVYMVKSMETSLGKT